MYTGTPIRLAGDFKEKHYRLKKQKQSPTTKNPLHNKDYTQI